MIQVSVPLSSYDIYLLRVGNIYLYSYIGLEDGEKVCYIYSLYHT